MARPPAGAGPRSSGGLDGGTYRPVAGEGPLLSAVGDSTPPAAERGAPGSAANRETEEDAGDESHVAGSHGGHRASVMAVVVAMFPAGTAPWDGRQVRPSSPRRALPTGRGNRRSRPHARGVTEPLAPHAVQNPRTNRLCYPVRTGKSTRWLTGTEVADRYRNRFSEAAAATDRAVERSS